MRGICAPNDSLGRMAQEAQYRGPPVKSADCVMNVAPDLDPATGIPLHPVFFAERAPPRVCQGQVLRLKQQHVCIDPARAVKALIQSTLQKLQPSEIELYGEAAPSLLPIPVGNISQGLVAQQTILKALGCRPARHAVQTQPQPVVSIQIFSTTLYDKRSHDFSEVICMTPTKSLLYHEPSVHKP